MNRNPYLLLSSIWQDAVPISWPEFSIPVLIATLLLSGFILYRRYRTRTLLLERIRELEILSEVGRAIAASELDLAALCQLIADQANTVIETGTFQIGLFDEDFYEIHYWMINGQPQEVPKSFNIRDKPGLISWVRHEKRSLLIHDFEKESAQLPAQPGYVSQDPPRSAIFIPLISGQQVLGIMAAQNDKPNAYSQDDLGRLTIVANQSGAAIANALLFEQERNRASQLELVSNIAHQVSTVSDLDELLNQVVFLTRETFGFESVNIYIVDDGQSHAALSASTLRDLDGDPHIQPGQGLVGIAMQNRHVVISNDTQADDRFVATTESIEIRSEIAIPLIIDQGLLGVLDVLSNSPGTFTKQTRSVLEALAAQITVAVRGARQLASQREQSWLTTAQLQVAEALSQASEVNELANILVRLTGLLVGVKSCVFLLWDSDFENYTLTAEYGISNATAENFQDLTLKPGDWSTLDAVHVGAERLVSTKPSPWQEAISYPAEIKDSAKANLIQPLIAKGEVIGVLVIGDLEPVEQPLTSVQDELLHNIANQAAQFLDNMQLHLAQQEEAWVNTALLQVSEAVNRLTNLNEILYTIVRMVPLLVGVRSCVILIRDEEHQTYAAGPSFGLSEMGEGLLASFEVDFSEFPLLEAQDIDRVGPDAAYYTFRLPDWMNVIMDSDTADIFPLHARARLVGALVVGPTINDRPLTGRRLNIVSGIAQQAAIAVVNDQLYKESAERSRMEQELDVARSIQASLIPQQAPIVPKVSLAGFWQAARQVSGDFYDFLDLDNDRWGIAIADVADKGVPASLFMALSRTILRTVAFNRMNPADVLERTNQLIFGDSTSDLFVTMFYAVWDPRQMTLSYANGGHNPPILVRKDGSLSLLSSDGIALGVLEQVEIGQKKISLFEGDLVIFYTDGVSEAMNEDYDEFGVERLCLIASRSREEEPEAIIQTITEAISDHAGDTPQFDDITLVVMKVDG